MKLSQLKLNDYFMTDSDEKFQLLRTPKMFNFRERQRYGKDRFEIARVDTGELFYVPEQRFIIRRI